MRHVTNDPQTEFAAIEIILAKALMAYGPARSSFEDDHVKRIEEARILAWRMVRRLEEETLRHN